MEEVRHTLDNAGSVDSAKLKKLIRPFITVGRRKTLTVRF